MINLIRPKALVLVQYQASRFTSL